MMRIYRAVILDIINACAIRSRLPSISHLLDGMGIITMSNPAAFRGFLSRCNELTHNTENRSPGKTLAMTVHHVGTIFSGGCG